jgi:hypothetical protein
LILKTFYRLFTQVTLGSSLKDILSELKCCGPCNGFTIFTAIMTKDLVSITTNRSLLVQALKSLLAKLIFSVLIRRK